MKNNTKKIIIDKKQIYKANKTKKVKGQLFSNDNPDTTVPNTGFKDKLTAENTIIDMKDRDIIYQFQVINTMYNRGIQVLKKTKNKEKKKNINAAISVFKIWLDNYKKNNRGKTENLPYLKLNTINKLEFLAEYFNISRKARDLEKPSLSDKGFLTIFREVNGNPAKLRNYPIKQSVKNGQTWDKHRNQYIKRRLQMLKNAGYGLIYNTNDKNNGLPTILHINMIMNGYSPIEKELLSNINNYKKIIKNNNPNFVFN